MALTLKVLVIDDSAHIRILLSKLLNSMDFETIETAENGRLGVEKAGTFKPDIVFLDGIMPEMDGLTALGEIKKNHPETLVVISSSLSERERVLQFKEAGADFYLLKPFERPKLEEIVKKALALLESRSKG